MPEFSRSDGPDALKILKAGGWILDPWQGLILTDWLARNENFNWSAPTAGGSVPRQNGKSHLVSGRANAGMLLYNEQVIYTAHLQKTATETFELMASFFDTAKLRKYLKDIKTAIGREQIILKSGARVKFLARTRNGGRGQHGDLLIFDEAQELSAEAQASFLPAISASLNPQTIYVGTPPEPESDGAVFRGIRAKALNGETTKTAWFEFSVDEIGDVHDVNRWAQTNPALGRRMLVSTVESEVEQMAPDTFARERLGWWLPETTETVNLVLDPDKWAACASDEPKPDGKTAYGIKFSPDASEVCVCGAVCPEEGPARVSMIERKSTSHGIQWLADWLNDRYKNACCVVIDGRNGVDLLVDKISKVWRYKGSVIVPRSKDVIAACSMFTDAVNEKTLTWYRLQEPLNISATTSIKRQIGAGFGFGGDDSLPVEACSLALWGCRNSKRDPSKKQRIG